MTNDSRDPAIENSHDYHGDMNSPDAGSSESVGDEKVIALIAAITLSAVIAIIMYAGWRY
jgi:hypothetical protein